MATTLGIFGNLAPKGSANHLAVLPSGGTIRLHSSVVQTFGGTIPPSVNGKAGQAGLADGMAGDPMAVTSGPGSQGYQAGYGIGRSVRDLGLVVPSLVLSEEQAGLLITAIRSGFITGNWATAKNLAREILASLPSPNSGSASASKGKKA